MMLRRTLLQAAGAASALVSTRARAFLLRPAGGASGAATQLATLTLVNTGGSTQAAGGVTPIFGWAFRQGDIPAGTAPQFLVSGVAQPYSWGCQSYWPDGSLCWAMFMLRTTAGIAGSGTLAVGVCGGGSAPAGP